VKLTEATGFVCLPHVSSRVTNPGN